MGGGRICIYSPRGWMSVGLAGDSANRKGSQRVCVCVRALHGIEEMMAIMDKILKIA